MKAFIDTSTLVKKYKQEPGREKFLKILTEITEIDLDIGYFKKIPLNEALERVVVELRQKYQLKSLDLIQLSCAKISQSQIFLTSDKLLYKIGSEELNGQRVEFVE